MVMHGQNELIEMLLGNKANDVITPDGDFNFFAPHLERDQQLDTDLLGIIDLNDETTLLPVMLEDAGCQVVEVVAETVEIPQQTPSTSSTATYTSQESEEANNRFIFQFPEAGTEQFSTIDLGFLTEVSDINDVAFTTEDTTDTESQYSTTPASLAPFSPTSPSYTAMPLTPDTASSLDSSSSSIPSFVKHGLKMAIKSKLQREGKGDLKVEFVQPAPEQLTEEEEMRRVEKRERNKLAAQKCREKKRIIADKLEAETKVLMRRQNKYKSEIQKLLDEREHLMEIINVHKAVCPKLRAKSTNF